MASAAWRLSVGRRYRPLQRAWVPLRWAVCHALVLIHVQITCSLFLTLTFALTPTLGAPSDTPTGDQYKNNISKVALTLTGGSSSSSSSNGDVKGASNSSINYDNLTGGQKLFNPRSPVSPSIKSKNENSNNSSNGMKDQRLLSDGDVSPQNEPKKPSDGKKTTEPQPAPHPTSGRREIKKEFPVALVTAASVAAFCILLFFLLAYIWHTRQLDSRARKLAIRLAADAEDGRRAMGQCRSSCRNCGSGGGGRIASSSSSGRYTLAPPLVRPDSVSSSHDKGQYEPLTCTSTSIGGGLSLDPDIDRGIGPESISGRSSVGVSESEAGDSEDVFEPATTLPVIPPDRLRGLRAGGRGAHRKWSRSRKSGSGSATLEKRDSAVTDKEILTHFASRRHSTFFI